jgi:MlaD protein
MTETNVSSLEPDKKGDATSTQPAAPGKSETAETADTAATPELTESDEGKHAIKHAQEHSQQHSQQQHAQQKAEGAEKQEVELSPAELREYRIGRADGLVGIFVLTALLLGYGALCWWKSYSPLNPPQRFSVVFRDVASLNYQAPVFVDGVRVGSVDKIQIRGSENVLVGLKVNTQKIAIPVGSRFIILPNGVVGAKYIEIILPEDATAQNKLPLLTEKSVVQGDDPIRPEIVVNELVEKLSTIDFSDMENRLSRNMDKLGNVADHVSVLSTKMEPVATKAQIAVDNVSALSNDMRAPVQQMHQILDQKHPLMHMMFGRPGHIKEEKTVKDDKGNVVKQTTKVDKGKDKDNKDSEDADSDGTKKKRHFWKL